MHNLPIANRGCLAEVRFVDKEKFGEQLEEMHTRICVTPRTSNFPRRCPGKGRGETLF